MSRYLLLVGLLAALPVHAGDLYRSIDSSGKVHYGDRPLQGSDDVEKLNFGKEPAPDDALPYETQRAKQNFPVTLYTFPDCGTPCQIARDFLSKRGIPFAETSLVKSEDYDAFRKASGDGRLPAATVGKSWLKGFQADEWNKQLDYAGYPKNAQPYYRPPKPASSVAPAQ